MTNEYIEILDIYFRLNEEIRYYFNTPKTRLVVKNRLKKEILFLDDVVCDERNNPPEIIDQSVILATVIYNKIGYEYKHLDLIFGHYVGIVYKPYLRYKKLQKIEKIMNL